MTNELIASALCFNLYRDITTRDELAAYLRSELMLHTDSPTDDDFRDAITRDINDALHNSNLDFFIPRAMLDDDRFDSDDAFDELDSILRDFDPALILTAILDRRP